MPGTIGLEGLLSIVTHYLSGRVVVVAEGPRAANDAVAVGTRPVGLPSADNHKVVAGQWIRVPDDDEEEVVVVMVMRVRMMRGRMGSHGIVRVRMTVGWWRVLVSDTRWVGRRATHGRPSL